MLAGADDPEGVFSAELRALVADFLGADAERWQGLQEQLPSYRGTLPDLLAARPSPTAGPAEWYPPSRSVLDVLAFLLDRLPAEDFRGLLPALPEALLEQLRGLIADPHRAAPGPGDTAGPAPRVAESALMALDLLRRACGDAQPPLPQDREVLGALLATGSYDLPNWNTPVWLLEACDAAGLPRPDHVYGGHTTELVTGTFREFCTAAPSSGPGREAADYADTALARGLVRGRDLLVVVPARFTLPMCSAFQGTALALALEPLITDLLARELGQDTDAWLRLLTAAAARDNADDTLPTWTELLERAATTTVDPALVVAGEWAAAGALLRRAPAEVGSAVLARLPEGVPALLTRCQQESSALTDDPNGIERSFAELGDGLVAQLLDRALDSGRMDGADLLIRTAPAARVLMYLSGALERDDLPHATRVALATLAEQVPLILGTDPLPWARLGAALTGRDPEWDGHGSLTDLLEHCVDGDGAG
jgi:hypothetical protein